MIRQNETEFCTMEQFEYSLEPNGISHNEAVRVFVKIMHGFTQKPVKVSLMYSTN